MPSLFGRETVEEISKRLKEQGLRGLNVREVLVLCTAHFDTSIAAIKDEISRIERIGWFIFGAIVSVTLSVVANLIVVLLTRK